MKLRTKLMLSPVTGAVMLVCVLISALWCLGQVKDRTAANESAMLQGYSSVGSLQGRLGAIHVELYRTMAVINTISDKDVKDRLSARKRENAEIDALASELAQAYAANERAKTALSAFRANLSAYAEASENAITLSTEAVNAQAMQAADRRYGELCAALNTTVEVLQGQSSQDSSDIAAFSQDLALAIGLFGLSAIGGCLVFAWIQQGKIYAEIDVARRAASAVAQGHLDQDFVSKGDDEIADLVCSMGQMVTMLRGSIAAVRAAAESIDVASSEIAAGTMDLSLRTEQTASRLQESASSLSVLTPSVRQSATSAKSADNLAGAATRVAQRGAEVISEVVSTMAAINTSSCRISEITSLIDGIAFQTNILALNAAVEAARAGDRGRGFAVVAGEVRTLAGRASNAAKEIKTLINESVERVEAGSRLVGDAGQVMQEILSSVHKVTGIIGEISAAANEQSDGICCISTAITQLDQATQQNAALVEQSAAASSSLKEQAANLTDVVGAFRVGTT